MTSTAPSIEQIKSELAAEGWNIAAMEQELGAKLSDAVWRGFYGGWQKIKKK